MLQVWHRLYFDPSSNLPARPAGERSSLILERLVCREQARAHYSKAWKNIPFRCTQEHQAFRRHSKRLKHALTAKLSLVISAAEYVRRPGHLWQKEVSSHQALTPSGHWGTLASDYSQSWEQADFSMVLWDPTQP